MRSNQARSLAIAAAVSAIWTLNASADLWQWNGDAPGVTADWQVAANWDPDTASPPVNNTFTATRLNVNGAQALVYSAAEGITTFAADTNDAPIGSRGLVIGSGTRCSGTMIITGGAFSTADSLAADVIGNNDNNIGTLQITGGSYTSGPAGTSLGVGVGSGRVSSLLVSGTGIATTTNLTINTGTANIDVDGGTLALGGITPTAIGSAATVRLNNGGILKARQSSTSFIPAHNNLQILVQEGGAVIDTNGFDITISEPLLQDFSSPGGDLTKDGEGLLTLAARSTVTGDVVVNAGGLGLRADPVGSWLPYSLTHAGDLLVFDLGAAAPSAPAVIDVLNLTVSSPVTVNVIGAILSTGQYQLIRYETKNITGSMTLGGLPAGVVATLEDDGNGSIYLDVTAVPPDFPVNDTFDSGTGAWYRATNNGTLTNESGRLRSTETGSNMDEAIGRSFTSQALNVGETIRLTFDLIWNSTTATANNQIFRAGFFNVTNPITAANWSGSNAIGPWGGYYTFVRDGNAIGNLARRESSASASNTVGPTNGATGTFTQIGSNTTNYDIANLTTYQGMFEVTYVSATQIDTLFTLMSGSTTHFSVAGSQTSGPLVTTFDTVVFKTGASVTEAFFDNVQVTVIPEPSSALLGGIGLLALFRRRR